MFWKTVSPVCRELKRLLAVRDAWIEWTLDDAEWIETVVVLFEYDTDPAGSSFRAEFLDQVRATVRADGPSTHRRIRIVPAKAVSG